MAADKPVGDSSPVVDPEACPLIPRRKKADCPARCRGCGFRAGAGGAEVLREDRQDAAVKAQAVPLPAAVCPRVPHRMKYTCSGKCAGCGNRNGLDAGGGSTHADGT